MDNINFTANYIRPTNIKAKVNNKFLTKEVAVVEIDRTNLQDQLCLDNIKNSWKGNYTKAIYNHLFRYPRKKDTTVYALTTQTEDFKNLDDKKVLCLAEMVSSFESKDANLSIFQVNPKHNSPIETTDTFLDKLFKRFKGKDSREYKEVGTGMLNCLKQIFAGKPITLSSVPEASDFYKKNGFVKTGNYEELINMVYNP